MLYLNIAIGTKYCHEILSDKHVKKINWSYLKQCLTIANGQDISKDIGENIWRLMKIVNIKINFNKYYVYLY